MKSKKVKYEEAVERNLSNLEKKVKSKAKANRTYASKYAEAKPEAAKIMLGIRKDDDSYDGRLNKILLQIKKAA